MGKRSTISFAASAVKDLENMRAWYVEQHVPEVGERLLVELVSSIETLADFPESGRVVPEFALPQLREIIHQPFRIVYRVGQGRVRIVRIWRSERLLKMP
jgi:toxin ParE1/3/4